MNYMLKFILLLKFKEVKFSSDIFNMLVLKIMLIKQNF